MQQRHRVRGQPGQAIGEGERAFAILVPAPHVFTEQRGAARVVGGFDQFGQGQGIAQAQVEALRSDRMQALRRIADQYRARGGRGMRACPYRRIAAAWTGFEEAAGAPAEGALQARKPGCVVERSDRVGFLARHAMDHAVMMVATRQQGGRAVIAETLPRAAVGRARGAHAGDEQRLAIVVRVGADAEAGAYRAVGAVGPHQQARGDVQGRATAVVDADGAGVAGLALQPRISRGAIPGQVGERGQPGFQCLAEIACHHHLAERFAPVIGSIQPDPAEVAVAAGMDPPDGRGGHLQVLHHAQRTQRIDRGFGKTQVALVEHGRQRTGRRGLDHRHVDADPVQRDGEAGADQAAPDDGHVVMAGPAGRCVRVLTHGCAMLPVPARPLA